MISFDAKKLTDNIKSIALSSGAELVGVASASQFESAPKGHRPFDLLTDARSVIVLACGRKLNEDRHYIQLVDRYYVLNFIALKESVRNFRQQATQCVEKVAQFLKNSGFKAIIESCGWSTTLSFRMAAYYAGLGAFGKGGFVVHPKLGPLNILACIVTDASLECEFPLDVDPCKDCIKCIEACKYKAITKDGFHTEKCRVFDEWDAANRIRKYGPCNAKCVNVCPVGT